MGILVQYILMLNAMANSSGNIDEDWIMTSGLWSDEGHWDDDEVWVD
jgi:hypothetical protein